MRLAPSLRGQLPYEALVPPEDGQPLLAAIVAAAAAQLAARGRRLEEGTATDVELRRVTYVPVNQELFRRLRMRP